MELNILNPLKVAIDECLYTSCYCEENIWKLCESIKNLRNGHFEKCYVVFISNHIQAVPIWKQKAGDAENDYLAVWDYHVVLVYANGRYKNVIYDLDTTLPFPVDFDTYSKESLRSEELMKDEYRRLFRVIPAFQFMNTFASDRSRMKRPDGTWIKEPPPYPCFRTASSVNNLDEFLSMQPGGIGEVLNFRQFNARFGNDLKEEKDEHGL